MEPQQKKRKAVTIPYKHFAKPKGINRGSVCIAVTKSFLFEATDHVDDWEGKLPKGIEYLIAKRELKTLKLLSILKCKHPILAIQSCPDQEHLLVDTGRNQIIKYNLKDETFADKGLGVDLYFPIEELGSFICRLTDTPDSLVICSIENSEKRVVLENADPETLVFAYHGDVVVGFSEKTNQISIWDISTGNKKTSIKVDIITNPKKKTQDDDENNVHFGLAINEKWVAFAQGYTNPIQIYDKSTSTLKFTIQPNDKPCECMGSPLLLFFGSFLIRNTTAGPEFEILDMDDGGRVYKRLEEIFNMKKTPWDRVWISMSVFM